jgi:hypothetical protein
LCQPELGVVVVVLGVVVVDETTLLGAELPASVAGVELDVTVGLLAEVWVVPEDGVALGAALVVCVGAAAAAGVWTGALVAG